MTFDLECLPVEPVSLDAIDATMVGDICDICEREFPLASLTAWDGDVCDECAAEHDRDLAAARSSEDAAHDAGADQDVFPEGA